MNDIVGDIQDCVNKMEDFYLDFKVRLEKIRERLIQECLDRGYTQEDIDQLLPKL